MIKVASVGDLILDWVVKISSLPKPEEMLMAERTRKELGGAANFCVTTSRLGLETYIIGGVGKDNFGDFLKEGLEAEGINTERLVRKQGKTKYTIVLAGGEGEKAFIGTINKDTALIEPKDIDKDNLRGIDALYFSGYSIPSIPVMKNERKATLKAFRLAKNLGLKVCFDFSPLISKIKRSTVEKIIQNCEVVFANLEEAKTYTNKESLTKITESLRNEGANTVAIKLGGKGSYVSNGEKGFKVDSFKVKGVDPTGAGDAFNAAFVYKHLKGKESLKEKARFANAVGALSVIKLGAGRNLPSPSEIEDFLEY